MAQPPARPPVSPDPALAGGGGGDTLAAVLGRRKGLIAFMVLLGAGAGLAYFLLMPRSYQVRGQMLVQRDVETFDGPDAYADSQETGRFLATQAEIVRSLPVLTQAMAVAAERLGLPAGGELKFFQNEPNRIAHLREELDVKVGQGYGIDVTLKSEHRREAVALVDAVMEAYQRDLARRSDQAAGNAVEALEAQYAQRHEEREAVRGQILELQRASGGTSMDAQGNATLRQLESANEELTRAMTATLDARQRYEQARAAFEEVAAEADDDADGTPAADRPAGVALSGESEDTIREQLFVLQQRADDLRQTYLPSHPTVRRIQANVAQLKGRLVAIAQNRFDQALAREERLQQQVEGLQEAGMTVSASATELALLQADMERLGEQLALLDARMSDAKVQQRANVAQVDVFEPANYANDDFSPKPATSVAGGAAVAGLLGVGLALVLESRRPRLPATRGRMAEAMALPVLGTLPAVDGATPRRLVLSPLREPGLAYAGAAVEAADALLADDHFAQIGTLLVTAPGTRQGRTTAAASLAVALAAMGKRVLLVDADLDKPDLHHVFDATNERGFAEVLRGECSADEAAKPTDAEGVRLLTAGEVRGDDPAELFNGTGFDDALAEMRAGYDVVVFDAPAESAGESARVAASGCDATLLVVRGGGTDRRRAEAARDRLLDVGANVGGLLINHAGGNRLAHTPFGGPTGVDHPPLKATA